MQDFTTQKSPLIIPIVIVIIFTHKKYRFSRIVWLHFPLFFKIENTLFLQIILLLNSILQYSFSTVYSSIGVIVLTFCQNGFLVTFLSIFSNDCFLLLNFCLACQSVLPIAELHFLFIVHSLLPFSVVLTSVSRSCSCLAL